MLGNECTLILLFATVTVSMDRGLLGCRAPEVVELCLADGLEIAIGKQIGVQFSNC